MMIPSSYQTAYSRREQIIDNITKDDSLDIPSAIKYVHSIQTDEQMRDFFESLESLDEIYPQMLYTSEDGTTEYLDDVDYDVVTMVQYFAHIKSIRDMPSNIGYYRLVPYTVNDDTLYSLDFVNKRTLIKDLQTYQGDPDYVNHKETHATRGIADKLYTDYDEATRRAAQHEMDDLIDGQHLTLLGLYSATLVVTSNHFSKLLKR